MKRKTAARWATVAWLHFAAIGVTYGETIIDDFTVGPVTKIANVANYNSTSGQSDLDPQHVIVGKRSFTLQGNMVSGSVEAVIDTGGSGQLRYLPHSPVFSTDNVYHIDFGGRVILTYLPGSRGMSYDFASLAPGDAFAIDVISSDFGTRGYFNGQIGMNGLQNLSQFTLHNSATPYTIRIPFSSIAINPATTPIRALTFDFTGPVTSIPADGTFVLDAIRVVPEPATLLSAFLAFAAFVAARRQARC
jgi:hypothetical protein